MGVNIKHKLEQRAADWGASVGLTESITIVGMVEALEPEIRRALPAALTPECSTRMALSSINNTSELAECTSVSFITALLNTARLGLEPNIPLDQAYLISYKNKGKLECQSQLGYRGLTDSVYRTGQVQIIQVQVVREFDPFEYQHGLDPELAHKLGEGARGEVTYVYGLFKLSNGGCGLEVSNKTGTNTFTARYSGSFRNEYSPWTEDYELMTKKTVIKRTLKYTPVSSDFQKTLSMDETIKTRIAVDVSEIRNECLPEEAGSGTAQGRAGKGWD